MVKALQAAVGNPEQFMHGIIEVTADTGPGQARRLGLQIEQLADLAALPIQARIGPAAIGQGVIEVRQHGHRQAAIGGDVLTTAEELRHPAGIAFQQPVQRHLRADRLPEEIRAQGLRPAAGPVQPVQAGGQPLELEARLASGDVQLTAPQWGRGRLASQGAAAEFEQAVLAPYSDWCDGLEKAGLDQDRRPLLLKPEQMSWQLDGEALTLSFFLPAGAFATSVVRELMQAEEADHGFRNQTDANSGQ